MNMHIAIRRPTNVSLDQELVRQAREEGINISRACQSGLEAAVKKARADKWLKENREAFDSWNEWTEQNGVPLARHRQF